MSTNNMSDRSAKAEPVFHGEDLVTMFRQQVLARSSDIAVKDDQLTLTYSELEVWSDVFCKGIADELGRYPPEAIVAVCFPRSTILVVSVLALAKAGLAYVTLDPDQSPHYLQKQVQQSKALLVLVASGSACPGMQATPAHCRIFNVEGLIRRARYGCNRPLEPQPVFIPAKFGASSASKNALLTVLFTSGTTGDAKGVMIEHCAMLNAVNADLCSLQSGERMAITANPAFDAWSFFVWYVLCRGAIAVMYTSHLADLDAFTKFVQHERIDKAFLPTAAFARLVQEPSLVISLGQTLRALVVAGERLTPQVVRAFVRVGSSIELINAYGPSETAVLATSYKVDPTADVNGGEIPIGRPIGNLSIHILNDHLCPLPPGETGEICISGLSLARGYLDQEQLTNKHFPYVKNLGSRNTATRICRTGDLGCQMLLDDGSFVLHYKGRRDNQMKVRGQRIEPAQIERVLLQQQVPGIIFGGQAAVVCGESDLLIAYVMVRRLEGSDGDDAERIRKYWNARCNDIDNWTDVDSSPTGADFLHWNSMYDGTPIPRVDMLDWLGDTLRSIPAKPEDSVLEIGCGTGMILFHVANRCQDYTGVDFSLPSIHYVRSQLHSRGLAEKVSLFHGAADQLPNLLPAQKTFSLVIINSAIQYFGSRTYLEDVIQLCLDRVDKEGRIFLGDVRSYSLLPHHDLTSALQRNSSDNVSTIYISEELSRLAQSHSELLVNPSFFIQLARNSNGRIRHVEIIPKEMDTLNELSQFRYQVILHIGPLPFTPLRMPEWFAYSSPQALENLLASHTTVAVCRIPNKAVALAQDALQLLSSDHPPPTSTALVEAAATSHWNRYALSASDLRRMARHHGHGVDISWGAQSLDYTLSAVFIKKTERVDFKVDFEGFIDCQSEPTNTPKVRQVRPTSFRELNTKLREACRAQLPNYMVPTQVILLDELPLTSNGKVNRTVLADPHTWRPYLISNSVPDGGNVVSARTKTEKLITEVLSEVLDLKPSGISIDADMFQLGLHSFSAVKVVAMLSDKLRIPKIPINVVYDSPTVVTLAALIDDHDKGAVRATDGVLSYGEDLERLYEALPTVLPPISEPKSKYTFFLTGATGFTGLFILRDLMLRRDYDVAKVVCLVRGSSIDACTRRLLENAAGRGIDTSTWLSEGLTLEVLQGDLGLLRFGLDGTTWKRMTDQVDIILANGSLVNFALDYPSLKPSNVGGCLTAIEMCTTTRLKALTFVSSTGIFSTSAYKARAAAHIPVLEADDLEDARTGLTIGYLQSKWVAEKLVMRMADHGMPCNIVRPCHIGGESTYGAVSNDDYFWRYTLGFVEMGLFPDKSTLIHWVTVNYTAAVCIAAAVAAVTGCSRRFEELAFHAVPLCAMTWSKYFEVLRSFGYELTMVPIDIFLSRLSSSDAKLSKDVIQFRDYYYADISDEDQLPECDGSNAQILLKRHHPWNRDERQLQQSLDIDAIGRCIAYMVAIGFMPPPSSNHESDGHNDVGFVKRKVPNVHMGIRNFLTIARGSLHYSAR